MAKPVSKYLCQNCGYSSLRWLGKCPECDSWNSFVEEIVHTDKRKFLSKAKDIVDLKITNLSKISEIDVKEENRIKSKIEELDRVLGGGIIPGSVILVGGDPGIGKSTLMMQLADKVKNKVILYVSGEESRQSKLN
jgi:DNA repair protein RadA/Sms